MDNHERSTLEQILNLLHGLIGRDDAKADFRPDLSFVSESPDSSETETLVFPPDFPPERKKKKALRKRARKKKSPPKNGGKVVF